MAGGSAAPDQPRSAGINRGCSVKRQSEQERARRLRRRELFKAKMCLQDCGRRAAKNANLCKECDDALCRQYFARIGERRPGVTPMHDIDTIRRLWPSRAGAGRTQTATRAHGDDTTGENVDLVGPAPERPRRAREVQPRVRRHRRNEPPPARRMAAEGGPGRHDHLPRRRRAHQHLARTPRLLFDLQTCPGERVLILGNHDITPRGAQGRRLQDPAPRGRSTTRTRRSR